MMRLSLHDPVLPINMESDRAGGVWEMAIEAVRCTENDGPAGPGEPEAVYREAIDRRK